MLSTPSPAHHTRTHTHSPPGHTFMENDRAFGVISRKAKKQKVIGSSKAWMKLARKAKRTNYHTMWMGQEHMRDWKAYLSAKYEGCPKRRWKNTDGEIVPFMKIRWFNFGVAEGPDGLIEHKDEVWYRLSLDTKEPWKKITLQRVRGSNAGLISDARWTLYPEPLELDPKKVRDLSRFKKWLPNEFHSLYPDPPPVPRKRKRSEGGEDDDTETDTDADVDDDDNDDDDDDATS